MAGIDLKQISERELEGVDGRERHSMGSRYDMTGSAP